MIENFSCGYLLQSKNAISNEDKLVEWWKFEASQDDQQVCTNNLCSLRKYNTFNMLGKRELWKFIKLENYINKSNNAVIQTFDVRGVIQKIIFISTFNQNNLQFKECNDLCITNIYFIANLYLSIRMLKQSHNQAGVKPSPFQVVFQSPLDIIIF